MEAKFSGLQPWAFGASIIECVDDAGEIHDLHNNYSLVAASIVLDSAIKPTIEFRFRSTNDANRLLLSFVEVDDPRVGWDEMGSTDDLSTFDEIHYYEQGTDISPVFRIYAGALSLVLRSSLVRLAVV